MSTFDRLLTSRPINRQALRVTAGGAADQPDLSPAELKRTAPPKRTTEEQLERDRWWASLTPEQQQAHKQAAYDAKVAKRAQKAAHGLV